MNDKIGLTLLTMFGIGHIKYAPGTVASFFTCLIHYYIFWSAVYSTTPFIVSYSSIIFILIIIYSIICIDKLSHLFKEKDPKEIVIDEFIGQSIPIYYFIWNVNHNYWGVFILLAFILFRFFDIFKIFPINMIDKKMKNGLGVVLDDVVAGIYTMIVLKLLQPTIEYYIIAYII